MPENASTFVQGLYIMAVGMGVVFAALILVMFAIMALNRIFKVKEKGPVAEVAKATVAPAPAPAAPAAGKANQELVAAIAIALALKLQSTGTPPSPVHVISLKNEKSVWAAVGRLQ
jgi:sodium pump decarboxylase gamma subunit